MLKQLGFTGRIEPTLEQRLGRKVDPKLADLGRNLFHDPIVGLNNDNSCAGCHAATAGFGIFSLLRYLKQRATPTPPDNSDKNKE